MDVKNRKVAVIGGDRREVEIVRSFRAAGADVATFGTIDDPAIAGLAADSLTDALRDADVIVGPMPGVGTDNTLYAPHASAPIRIDSGTLASAKRGAVFFNGHASPTMQEAGDEHGVTFLDIGDSDFVQVQHAVPTAEAAVAIAVQETAETVNASGVLVVGFGRIAMLLAQYLRGLGARVTVAARRPEVRARAVAMGHQATGTDPEDLASAVEYADIVYTTAPAMLIDAKVLARCNPEALLVDLASPPGGLHHEGARSQGLHVVWARAQAGSAWRHSGRAQFQEMQRLLTTRQAGGVR